MDLLKDSVNRLYVRFLLPAMGSAIVISIYSFVDTIAVGQAESEPGAAAMAVLLPFFAIMAFIAVLTGMGGAVLMSQAFGEGDVKKSRQMFTISCVVMFTITGACWALFGGLNYRIFYLFGATDELMPKVMEYADWLIWFFPMFVLPNFMGCFVRNDKSPSLVMAAVIIGGIVNIFGDWYFVFPLGMGMKGAAIATVSGTVMQSLVMCLHFMSKRNNLKFTSFSGFVPKAGKILASGFCAGFLDLGTVVISCVMNNQVMKYGTTAHLAVFGVISTIAALWQALFSGVGQAVQPIAAQNYGAKNKARIKKTLTLGFSSILALAAIFILIGEVAPTPTMRLFMAVTPEVLAVAPRMTRIYSVWYLFLGVNVLGVYYLQAIAEVKMTLILAALRSVILNVVTIYVLPLALGMDGVMLALPISEAAVAILTIGYILYVQKFKMRSAAEIEQQAEVANSLGK